MSWDINRVIVVGRLSNDVELKYTPSNTAVAHFGIAVGGKPKADGGDSVSFFNVVVWGKTAAVSWRKESRSHSMDAWNSEAGRRRTVQNAAWLKSSRTVLNSSVHPAAERARRLKGAAAATQCRTNPVRQHTRIISTITRILTQRRLIRIPIRTSPEPLIFKAERRSLCQKN